MKTYSKVSIGNGIYVLIFCICGLVNELLVEMIDGYCY